MGIFTALIGADIKRRQRVYAAAEARRLREREVAAEERQAAALERIAEGVRA